MWAVNDCFWRNPFWQIWQTNGFSFECFNIWWFRNFCFNENVFGHSGHSSRDSSGRWNETRWLCNAPELKLWNSLFKINFYRKLHFFEFHNSKFNFKMLSGNFLIGTVVLHLHNIFFSSFYFKIIYQCYLASFFPQFSHSYFCCEWIFLWAHRSPVKQEHFKIKLLMLCCLATFEWKVQTSINYM